MNGKSKKIKYPFKKVKPAEDPTSGSLNKAVQGSMRRNIASGGGKPKRAVPRKFLEMEKASADSEPINVKIKPPNWLYALERKGASAEVVLDNIRKRLLRAPNKRAFQLAQQIINEMSRKKGGKFISKLLTHKAVDEFQSKED